MVRSLPGEGGCCQSSPRWVAANAEEQAVKPPSDTSCLCETKSYDFLLNVSSELKYETGYEQLTIQLYVLIELKILKNVI